MSLHTSVADLAQQRGLADDAEQKSNVHFLHIAPDAPETRVRVGDIVQLVWQRKVIYGRVLTWSGQPDGLCRLIDLRCQTHRRFVDSLSREIPADELPALVIKFDELVTSKRGKAAIKPPVVSDWAPESGGGAPQRCDIPLVLRDKSHAAWPAQRLINYVSRPSDRQLLLMMGRRDSRGIREAEWQALQVQWHLRQVLGDGRKTA